VRYPAIRNLRGTPKNDFATPALITSREGSYRTTPTRIPYMYTANSAYVSRLTIVDPNEGLARRLTTIQLKRMSKTVTNHIDAVVPVVNDIRTTPQ
jgi:hypothetical protein